MKTWLRQNRGFLLFVVGFAFFRSAMADWNTIPSGSMRPTLLEGDYLFVTKWAYGYSRHSLPFSPPIFSGRIWGGQPARGDVVVFKFPPNPSLDYIKRVVGLPGDTIQMRDGQLFINGVGVPREKVDEASLTKD